MCPWAVIFTSDFCFFFFSLGERERLNVAKVKYFSFPTGNVKGARDVHFPYLTSVITGCWILIYPFPHIS